MIQNHLLPVAFSLLFFVSCQNSGQGDAVKTAEAEVFKIHDEVMPRVSDIMKLQKQLKQRIAATDSAQEGQNTPSATLRTDEEKEQAMRLNRRLAEADSLMMNWMSNYNGDTLVTLKPELAIQYLDAEKQKIADVQKKITSSIADAKQFLGVK
ncbi:MAG: viral A-type inclusion protein [Rudanella sp.]|nr:viral A-type inclusion protein [Rudanella sp.]